VAAAPRAETTEPRAEDKLRRGIGFFGLLAFSVGINIGAGLFILVNVAAGLTGPSIVVAMLIAAVPALLALVPYTMLACGYPTVAGTYRYAKLLHPGAGFAVAAVLITAVLIGGQPLFAIVAGEYLGELIPVPPLLIGVISLVVFFGVNLLGVRPTALIQITLIAGLLLALALFVVMGAGSVQSENFTPFLDGGVPGLLAAAGLLFALMAGGLGIIDVGDEVKDPRRLYRQVLPLGMFVVLVFYIGIMIVTGGAVRAADLADETLVIVAEEFMGSAALGFFIVAGAAVAGLTTLNVIYTLVARALMVLSADGLLPRTFREVSNRSAVPHYALAFAFVVSTLALLAGPPREFLGAILNVGLVTAVALVALSASRVPRNHPEIFERSGVGISVRTLKGACYSVVVLNSLIFLLLTAAAPLATLFQAVVAAVAFFHWRRRASAQAPPAEVAARA
jgi:basic amino acid/polyamine antiporter, APA family